MGVARYLAHVDEAAGAVPDAAAGMGVSRTWNFIPGLTTSGFVLLAIMMALGAAGCKVVGDAFRCPRLEVVLMNPNIASVQTNVDPAQSPAAPSLDRTAPRRPPRRCHAPAARTRT